MRKLMTLKDIELYHKINTDVKDDYDILYNELKDAARGWIKDFEKYKEEHTQKRVYKASDYKYISEEIAKNKYIIIGEETVNWIKFFFNLEE